MPFGFPVLLELAGRCCVVIGALPVAEGKVEALLAGGADDVLVVATGPAARLDALEGVSGVAIERRRWEQRDLVGASLVIAHDEDPSVRFAIAAAARSWNEGRDANVASRTSRRTTSTSAHSGP